MSSFSISNFRLFNSEGVKVDLSPVTILTGANSSGKSSFVKAMILLSDWLERIRNDFEKNGSFCPHKVPMDFSRADLKLKGFNGTINRNADPGSKMVFSLDVDLDILGEYTVEYTFVSEKEYRDRAILDSITIFCDGIEYFSAHKENEKFITTKVDGFYEDFIELQKYVLIPQRLWRGKLYDEVYEQISFNIADKKGRLDMKKLYATKESERLKLIQGKDVPNWSYALRKTFLPGADKKTYPYLFDKDLTLPFEKMAETNIMFYFPVLDRFRNASKEECISILQKDMIKMPCLDANYDLDKIVDAFKNSEEENFLDFYIRLEEEFLSTYKNESQYRNIIFVGCPDDYIKNIVVKGFGLQYSSSIFGSNTLFGHIYDALSSWQWEEDYQKEKKEIKDNGYIERNAYNEDSFYSKHKIHEAYIEFVDYMLHLILLSGTLSEMTYFNDSFSSVQRLHSFEENSLIVRNINKYLDNMDHFKTQRTRNDHGESYVPDTFINKWLRELNIGKSLIIEMDSEGLGFKLFIDKDGYKESLADLGHGITQIVSLLVLIESTILDQHIRLTASNKLKDTGHVYPIIYPAILAIEEPEVSLHPNYQSMLTSLFEDAATNYGVNIIFLVETHSEYMVRKTQVIVSDDPKKFEDNPFKVYYFKRDGGMYELVHKPSGRFERPFGEGFFDESARLNYQLLKKEQENLKRD